MYHQLSRAVHNLLQFFLKQTVFNWGLILCDILLCFWNGEH